MDNSSLSKDILFVSSFPTKPFLKTIQSTRRRNKTTPDTDLQSHDREHHHHQLPASNEIYPVLTAPIICYHKPEVQRSVKILRKF